MRTTLSFCLTICLCVQVFGRSIDNINYPVPNKPTDHAKVARELVHKSDWTSLGTVSIAPEIKGYPQLNVLSVADGYKGGESTGNIYFYLTDISAAAKNLKAKNVATVLFSDEQSLSCSKNGIDPMEPTCARTIISGQVVEVPKNSKEHENAKKAFVSRHPAAELWEEAHSFRLYKIQIKNILVLDWYGGAHNIPVDDYYKVKL